MVAIGDNQDDEVCKKEELDDADVHAEVDLLRMVGFALPWCSMSR